MTFLPLPGSRTGIEGTPRSGQSFSVTVMGPERPPLGISPILTEDSQMCPGAGPHSGLKGTLGFTLRDEISYHIFDPTQSWAMIATLGSPALGLLNRPSLFLGVFATWVHEAPASPPAVA